MLLPPTALLMATLLVLCAGEAVVAAGRQQDDFNVMTPPYDTPVQDLLAPILAFGAGPMGGAAFLGAAADAPAVCARHEPFSLTAPVTATAVDGLFYAVSGVAGRLDPTHRCYLDTTHTPPQCTASLASTAADCGGAAGSAVGPPLNATPAAVAVSAAAELAAYVQSGAAQRLKLERSLRRTREAVFALSHIRQLVLSANATITDPEELALVLRAATQHVLAVADAAYARVMDKYYVLDAVANTSLGIYAAAVSDAVGPAVGECPVHDFIRRLLWGGEALATVQAAIIQSTLALADSVHTRTYRPAVRGVQCAELLTGLALMTLEDAVVRQLAAEVALNTLNESSVWAVQDFDALLASRTAALRQRQLWSLAYVFAALADPEVVDELVSGADVAECMRRAALVVPDSESGTVPPSIYWCLDNASMDAMPGTAVATRALAVRESTVAANGQCVWGYSVWDGQCGGAAFSAARCETCPPGSVGDGEGHCVCGDAAGAYATLTGGCLDKGPAHDTAGLRLLHASGTVALAGGRAVPLLSVQLPQTASLSDPSAFLRVSVTCDDGGRGGGTQLLATPHGTRGAACDSVIAYERHAERTGERSTFAGSLFLETYAENLTISALGTAAFYGETCTATVEVASALRRTSRALVAGVWTFLPAAEPVELIAESYTGVLPADGTAAPAEVPLCSQGRGTSDSQGRDASAAMSVGVCRTSSGDPAVFIRPNAYTVFGASTQRTVAQRARSSAGASRDAAFLEAVQSLAHRTSLELTVEGGGTVAAPVLWSGAWLVDATPLAAQAWGTGMVVPLSASVLRGMRAIRVRVVDANGTSAFAAYEGSVACRYGSDADSDSSADSTATHGDQTTDAASRHYDAWYVILIAIVAVLDAAVLVGFAGLVYLHCAALDRWPKRLR